MRRQPGHSANDRFTSFTRRLGMNPNPLLSDLGVLLVNQFSVLSRAFLRAP